MNNLIIRRGRVVLEQPAQRPPVLTLKLCVGSQIYKMPTLEWKSVCRRWQTQKEIRVSWCQEAEIELEVYYQSEGVTKVVGEGVIDMAVFSGHFNQEIKIALTYEGVMTGWLYCTLALEGSQDSRMEERFLWIYKLSFVFLQEENETFKIEIFQNTLPIFEKQFSLAQKVKTIFPNLKKPINYSDVIRLALSHPKKQYKTISFLVDNIKRGRVTNFNSWIRNKHNNKTADLRLQYFLQNLFLQNDRKIASRKGLYNATYSTESNIMKISDKDLSEATMKPDMPFTPLRQKHNEPSQDQNDKLVRTKKADQSQILKLRPQGEVRLSRRNPVEHSTEQIRKNENAIPCLRQSKTNFVISKSKVVHKTDKKQFYFENPLDL